ncbi:MAG: shikimate dehydrogenase [Bacillota bacterium]|nr:shikimate dehydrogenase [Bacillota bacterium]
MFNKPSPATIPTMYFIGVTTGQSSIMKMFPLWAKELGIDACIKGIDLPVHADPEDYRAAAQFIKSDPLSMGALVTTHKIDMYKAASDLFDYIDPYAQMFGELSSISKLDGKFCAHAKDPITCGMALYAFIPKNYWKNCCGEVCILGAGGSALSISAYLAGKKHGENTPSHIHMDNRSAPRLAEAVRILGSLDVPMSFHLCKTPELNDRVVGALPERSLVVNATGLGKDRPGSPITDKCIFPKNGIIWELNYRGSLEFMAQAERQKSDRNLFIEDGWTYFIYGWTQVIAEVFHTDISGERLRACDRIARQARGQKRSLL